MKYANHSQYFSFRRVIALCKKETYQILRDPSSGLIAFFIPIMLLFIFGYGINLDSSRLHIGILMHEQTNESRDLVNAFHASPYILSVVSDNRQQLVTLMQEGKIRGIVVIPVNFSQNLNDPKNKTKIQIITDGSEPNTANFVQNYVSGVWQIWSAQRAKLQGKSTPNLINIEMRSWFNDSLTSRNFIIPGAITIIMTVIGAILTSLVIAREWERGTMEALLSTPISRAELLIAKLVPYYILGILVQLLCLVVGVFIMKVPFKGSLTVLLGMSSLFLLSVLGIGLLISTLTKNQFNAAVIALNVAFLPAVMLSGFVFEINSMPGIIQAITYVIPARYFVSTLQTLFLAGNIPSILLVNLLFLIAAAVVFIGITAMMTRRRLD